MSYTLSHQSYDKPEKVNAFNEGLLARLRTMPGIRSAALGSTLPGNGWGSDDVFTIPEHPPIKPGAELPDALNRVADPGYFAALGIPLLQGRFFTNQDRDAHANQVIISRQLAAQYFPGDNPIGRHLVVSEGDKSE